MTCGGLPQPGRRWVKAETHPEGPGGQMGSSPGRDAAAGLKTTKPGISSMSGFVIFSPDAATAAAAHEPDAVPQLVTIQL